MQENTSRSRARKQFVFAICLLAIALAGYLLTRPASAPAPEAAPGEASAPTSTPAVATGSVPSGGRDRALDVNRSGSVLEGEYVCLPRKDKGGPQTLECALGLRADDGSHYALSASGAAAESASATTPTGARVRVTGTVVPVAALSSTRWDAYDIVGVVDVKEFSRK